MGRSGASHLPGHGLMLCLVVDCVQNTDEFLIFELAFALPHKVLKSPSYIINEVFVRMQGQRVLVATNHHLMVIAEVVRVIEIVM